ncbi:HNH endonuclease [Rufibacter immobilis]|uniref:HNH endonuclease n=1 Tax=Rufibacter immobilis TaxID=1348778 RepID=UPI0035EC582F
MNDPTNSKYRHLSFKDSGPYRRFVQEEKKLQAATLTYQQQDTPAHGSYGALLFKPEWRAKREEILQRDRHACVVCKGNDGLQVHHRQYHFIVRQNEFKMPWDYPGQLLITLCESCHKRGHNKFKVPTINI